MQIVSGSNYIASNKRQHVLHVGEYYYLFYNKAGASIYPYYRVATTFAGLAAASDVQISSVATTYSQSLDVCYHPGLNCFGMTFSPTYDNKRFVQMSIGVDGSLTVLTDHVFLSDSYAGYDLSLSYSMSPARWAIVRQSWTAVDGPVNGYIYRSSDGYPTSTGNWGAAASFGGYTAIPGAWWEYGHGACSWDAGEKVLFVCCIEASWYLIAKIRNLNANTWDTALISSTFPVKQVVGNGFEGVSSPVMGVDGFAYIVYVHKDNLDLRLACFNGTTWNDIQIAAASDWYAPTLTRNANGWYITCGDKVGSVYRLRVFTKVSTTWSERTEIIDTADYEMSTYGASAPRTETTNDRFAAWSYSSINGQLFMGDVVTMSRAWPKLRHETASLNLDLALAPSFPANAGTRYYTFPTEWPAYVTTERLTPATEVSWALRNVKDVSEPWAFWDTTLARGTLDFTLIDHEGKMLFDTVWPSWDKTWSKLRGGVHNVDMQMVSPFPRTLPVFGAYLTDTSGDVLVDHGLDTSVDLALTSSGLLINKATDSHVLRSNGYALRLADGDSSAPVGASNDAVSFSAGMGDGSISVFGQFKIRGTMNAGATVRLVELADSSATTPSNYMRLYMTDNSGTLNVFLGWSKAGASEIIQITGDKTMTTWYDVGMSHDAVSGKTYLYFAPSVITTQWSLSDNFLYNSTPVSVPLSLVSSDTAFPSTVTWTRLRVMRGAASNVWSTAGYAYGQNMFVFNGHMTPHHFNFMRRVSHMWNNKTTGTWPK